MQIKLIHVDREEDIEKGMMITDRNSPAPVAMIIEANVRFLELLDYKPIVSRGYTCMFHCHTIADDAIIKDIVISKEKNASTGEIETKEAPKFVKSFADTRCRITTKAPVCIEKFSEIPALGRFTLRDEGKTIAVGEILRYKPHKVDGAVASKTVSAATEVTKKLAEASISSDKTKESVFNMETGQMEEA